MVILYGIGIAIIFFVFIMPQIEKAYNNENKELIEKLENILSPTKIDTNKCSRSCCINSGWPVPKELQPKDMTPEELLNYIPTNFSCNAGSNTGGGCVCITKNNYEELGSRGGNGVSGCNY